MTRPDPKQVKAMTEIAGVPQDAEVSARIANSIGPAFEGFAPVAGTLPFEFTKNYKFTILNNENVWAKAMNRVVSEKVPVEKAVDEMIARIKEVAG